MGAPTRGRLVLSNGINVEDCNPSMVWSDDSEYLAVPQWTEDREQRLAVISMSRRKVTYAPGKFRVLELHTFSQGKIKAVDSPIYQPREVEIVMSELKW
ncbi:MAG TPA: hypothetical protein VLJ61_13340 [Pyrinomonadaceae bacterium]|nr:hypothetical protein [Pyrinomonadaceae bacterium]